VEELLILLVLLPVAIWRQMREHGVSGRRLLLPPAIFLVLGITGMAGGETTPADAEAIAYLAVSGALAIGFGAWRGLIMPVWRADGGWRAQGNRTTLTLWVVMLASKLGLAAAASATDVFPGDHPGEIYSFIALSYGIENTLIARRTILGDVQSAPG
jgi:hypothetical protein